MVISGAWEVFHSTSELWNVYPRILSTLRITADLGSKACAAPVKAFGAAGTWACYCISIMRCQSVVLIYYEGLHRGNNEIRADSYWSINIVTVEAAYILLVQRFKGSFIGLFILMVLPTFLPRCLWYVSNVESKTMVMDSRADNFRLPTMDMSVVYRDTKIFGNQSEIEGNILLCSSQTQSRVFSGSR